AFDVARSCRGAHGGMEESRGASEELGMSVQRTQGCALKVRAAQAWRHQGAAVANEKGFPLEPAPECSNRGRERRCLEDGTSTFVIPANAGIQVSFANENGFPLARE